MYVCVCVCVCVCACVRACVRACVCINIKAYYKIDFTWVFSSLYYCHRNKTYSRNMSDRKVA